MTNDTNGDKALPSAPFSVHPVLSGPIVLYINKMYRIQVQPLKNEATAFCDMISSLFK